jgi:hypothetical protein
MLVTRASCKRAQCVHSENVRSVLLLSSKTMRKVKLRGSKSKKRRRDSWSWRSAAVMGVGGEMGKRCRRLFVVDTGPRA